MTAIRAILLIHRSQEALPNLRHLPRSLLSRSRKWSIVPCIWPTTSLARSARLGSLDAWPIASQVVLARLTNCFSTKNFSAEGVSACTLGTHHIQHRLRWVGYRVGPDRTQMTTLLLQLPWALLLLAG